MPPLFALDFCRKRFMGVKNVFTLNDFELHIITHGTEQASFKEHKLTREAIGFIPDRRDFSGLWASVPPDWRDSKSRPGVWPSQIPHVASFHYSKLLLLSPVLCCDCRNSKQLLNALIGKVNRANNLYEYIKYYGSCQRKGCEHAFMFKIITVVSQRKF